MSRTLLAVTVAMVVGLSGCSLPEKDADAVDARLLEGAAKGRSFTGTGYTLRVPKRWGPPPHKITGLERADLALFDLSDRDEFTDNVNVIVAPPGSYDVDDLEATMLNEMGTVGATQRRAGEPVLVAGRQATHVSGLLPSDGASYFIEQYHPVKDDQVFIVTFSFSPDVGQAQRLRTAESVLASWTWQS